MDKFGIKATLYDLLGYFVPGFLTLLLIYMWCFDKDIVWLISLQTATYSTAFYFLVFIFAYVTGHIISSFTSILFENRYVSKVIKNTLKCILKKDTVNYNEKSNVIFNQDFDKVDKRILSSYCQKNNPEIYNTAFVFKSIYGLSRNLFVSFVIYTSIVIGKCGLLYEGILAIIVTLLIVWNYIRFKDIYTKKIISAWYV